jgi:transcriptional regulator with XRE-family HTH domain
MRADGRCSDEAFGANLRALREDNGISQPELARRMVERGWPWHQSTVYRTESGRQPLKLGEAVDLARILGVTVDRLAGADPAAAEEANQEWRRKSRESLVLGLEGLLREARAL